jgi:hypothetical protein
MSRKSTTCYGKASGQPLTEYASYELAEGGASYVQQTYGQTMVPYLCQDCGQWHLSPVDRYTEHSTWSCSCLGRNRSPKDCYQTKVDATRRAEILWEESRERLYVYQCPFDDDIWHLTKRPPIITKRDDSEKEDDWYLDELWEY